MTIKINTTDKETKEMEERMVMGLNKKSKVKVICGFSGWFIKVGNNTFGGKRESALDLYGNLEVLNRNGFDISNALEVVNSERF